MSDTVPEDNGFVVPAAAVDPRLIGDVIEASGAPLSDGVDFSEPLTGGVRFAVGADE